MSPAPRAYVLGVFFACVYWYTAVLSDGGVYLREERDVFEGSFYSGAYICVYKMIN